MGEVDIFTIGSNKDMIISFEFLTFQLGIWREMGHHFLLFPVLVLYHFLLQVLGVFGIIECVWQSIKNFM
jgi:hypothetical protein